MGRLDLTSLVMPTKRAVSRVRNMELAKRVKIALVEDGRRDYEVAKAAGVTASWLSSLKNGWNNDPDPEKLRALARELGKPSTYFTEVIDRYRLMGNGRHPADAFVVGGRNMSALTDADREVVLQVAERLKEIAERGDKSASSGPGAASIAGFNHTEPVASTR